jgi:sterol desaturase/sphingolipid hydroxylase (fatty acid hydroxylase superfamily)
MINLFFGIIIMLSLCLLEIIFIKYKQRKVIPWREIIFNLNSGHTILWIFRGLEVYGFSFISNNFNLHLLDPIPVWLQWIFTFIAWDFCFYWMHRIHHKYKILWAVHVVHHEGEHFNFSLGIRNSWYSSITSFPFFVILAIIGVSTEQFLLIGALHYFIQFYNHNSIIKSHGFVDKIFVSPSHHQIHHASNLEYRDKNCGGTFAIWDRLFGTFQSEIDGIEIKLGVPSSKHSIDHPIIANNAHFRSIFKRNKITKKFHFTKKRSEFHIFSGGIFLFIMLIIYIYKEDKNTFSQLLPFSILLLIGTIAIHGLFENKLISKIIWMILCISLLSISFFDSNFLSIQFIVSVILFLHSFSIFFVNNSTNKIYFLEK